MTQPITLRPPTTPATIHRPDPPHRTDTEAVPTDLGPTPPEPTTLHEEGAL